MRVLGLFGPDCLWYPKHSTVSIFILFTFRSYESSKLTRSRLTFYFVAFVSFLFTISRLLELFATQHKADSSGMITRSCFRPRIQNHDDIMTWYSTYHLLCYSYIWRLLLSRDQVLSSLLWSVLVYIFTSHQIWFSSPLDLPTIIGICSSVRCCTVS